MRIYLLISVIIMLVDGKASDYEVIDLSDILNADYMPGSLLVLENLEENPEYRNDTNASIFDHRGTFDTAFATMGYHRKMMNEYLCRSYVSEQIISEMKSTRIRRRLGNPAEHGGNVGTLASKINFSIKNSLLEDEGSSNYQDWLKKSATLEDIYRHYDNAQNREAPESGRDADEEASEEYDTHITGYGYQQSQAANSPSKLGHSETGGGYSYHAYPSGGVHSSGGSAGGGLYGGSSGYGGGGSYFSGHSDHMMYGGGGSAHGYGGGQEHTPKHHGGHDDKDKLADLFDIALTALAYLSFGMFIIQVIMCISMANTSTASAMAMMPMSLSPTGGETTGGMMAALDVLGGGGMNGGGIASAGDIDGGGTTGGQNGNTGVESTVDGSIQAGTAGGTRGEIVGTAENTIDDFSNGNNGIPWDGDGVGQITGEGVTGEEATNGGGTSTGLDDEEITSEIDRENISGSTGEGSISRATTGSGEGSDEFPTGEGDMEGSIIGGGVGNVYSAIQGTTGWGADGDGGNGNNGFTDGGTTGDQSERTTTSGSIGTGGTGGTGTATATGTGDGRDGLTSKRKRRDIPIIVQPNNEALNELARRILISIEAALVAHQDDGNCLRKTLCENNVYSRSLDSSQKYWVPIWSLGMSWLSGRLVQNVPRATSMLDSLKASLLGLGKADCELLYRNCDLSKERHKRQRRRRKRASK